MTTRRLVFASRPSALARWQTQFVIGLLSSTWQDLEYEEKIITTQGDRILDKPLPEIGGKGLFTHELEQALLGGKVDAAVHSLKDLPIEEPPGLVVPVVPERADARDVLACSSGHTLDDLPAGAIIGTSSLRRGAQLKSYREDLEIRSIRGNVDTRIRKAKEGQYHAVVLAAAGVIRLGLLDLVTHYLPLEIMLPAPGQGALAVQCRQDDGRTIELLEAIGHSPTQAAVSAERTFLEALGGGCSLPVGAFAEDMGNSIKLQAVVAAPDGSRILRFSESGSHPQRLGRRVADLALREGAAELLSLEDQVV